MKTIYRLLCMIVIVAATGIHASAQVKISGSEKYGLPDNIQITLSDSLQKSSPSANWNCFPAMQTFIQPQVIVLAPNRCDYYSDDLFQRLIDEEQAKKEEAAQLKRDLMNLLEQAKENDK